MDWQSLASHLWSSWTPILLVAFLVTKELVRRAPGVERHHVRIAGSLFFGHLVAVAIGGAQQAAGYAGQIAGLTALAFGVLAFMNLGITAGLRVILPQVGLRLPRIMIDLVTAFSVVIAFIIVGKRAGFSVAGLITTSAVVTAVIGFSLQDTLANVMGGLSVQLDKSVTVGDWISLGPGHKTGRVTEIRWRYTAIETRDWETVIIPNNTLMRSQVIIFGRRAGEPSMARRQIDFFVDFRTPPTDVIAAVEDALCHDPVPRMAVRPPPHALFFGIRDSYAHYCVRYWLDDISVDDPTDSAVRVRVWYALRRAGIPLSIPASSVFVTHETVERETRKTDRERARRLDALASVDLFRGLPEDLRANLARQLEFAPFAAGEAVTHEGDRDDGLFILVEGEASVRISVGADEEREEREVARLTAGQFFGEMSLMTGEARTATVVAATDLLCYRIDKPAFQHILQQTPSIADQIAEVLVTRRTALTAAHDDEERDASHTRRMQTAKQHLLGRIRGFFGISGTN